MQFWLLTLITHGVLAVHTSGASPQRSASHLLTFLVAQLQFFANGNFQIVDCTRFSNVDYWFEVTPKKEIPDRFTHFKNMRSFCATLYNGNAWFVYHGNCFKNYLIIGALLVSFTVENVPLQNRRSKQSGNFSLPT